MDKGEKRKEARIAAVNRYVADNYANGDLLRYDLLSRKVQVYARPWRDITDRDINTIVVNCASETGLNVTAMDVQTILHSELVREVHPLREWLGELPPYTPEMGDWIGIVASEVTVAGDEAEQTLWRECFKKWFVAMVASWLDDDIVNHQVLVLIGRQGIYKTTWLEHLIPPELRAYVTKLASSRELGKDDRIRIAEFGLINMDEIDSMTPKELNVMKSVITAADVNERAAYGYTKERRIRCASFCASGNNKQFLTDDTGNRRWLPFEAVNIVSPWGIQEHWTEMYAQALYLIDSGYAYWFKADDIDRMEAHNEDFESTKNEAELLPVYFSPVAIDSNSVARFMSASEILGKLVAWGSVKNPMSVNKFGGVLKKAGYEQRKIHGRCGYVAYEISVGTHEQELAQTLLRMDAIRNENGG